jgi:formate dehydrogenase subunit delta
MTAQPEVVRMANDIARHFAVYPVEEAVPEIANHIRSFWTPDMRAQVADLARRGTGELSPLALTAILTLSASS